MTRPGPDLRDALLVLAALVLHLGGAYLMDMMPPDRVFEWVIIGLPALVVLVALVAVHARGERRPLQLACLVEWLLVLYTLPAKLAGLALVPAALVLSIPLLRPATASPGPGDPERVSPEPRSSGPVDAA